MQKLINRQSLYAFFLCVLTIFAVSLMKGKWKKSGTEAVLSWDVTGYYLYLPTGLIYQDFEQIAFRDSIMEKYHPSGSFYQAYQVENGNWLLQYPSGMAVMYAPGFLIGHLGALMTDYPEDGFSIPYQFGIWLWGLLVAFLGLWLLRKFLLHYFSDQSVAITLLVLAIATNYLNYTAIDGALTHNYEFTLYAALLLFTRKWYLHPNYKDSIVIGLLIGLSALARPSDIVIAIVPLAWGLVSLKSIPKTIQFLLAQFPKLFLAAIITILVGSIQLLYWKLYSGDWIVYTYRDYGFSWRGQHLYDCFLSYKKGWLIYTPVMTFALAGFWFLFKKRPALFWFSFLFFIVNTYIIFSWDIWWYGGSFGQRAMVESYAILAIPLTMFIETASKSFWKYLLIPAFIFCGWLNLMQTYQIHAENGGMDPEYMTKAYYWRIFGKTEVTNRDRILMDTDEDYTGPRKNVQLLLSEDFETYTDSTNVRPGFNDTKMSMFLNGDFQYSPEMKLQTSKIDGEWLRVKGDFYAEWKEWEIWKMSQLIVDFYNGEEKVKTRMIRVFRVLEPKQWTPISMDIQVPDADFDLVKVWVWHADSKTNRWADDFTLESFDEE